MSKNKVLESTRFLVENPKHVHIDTDKLDETADRFAKEKLKIPDWKTPVHLEQSDETFIDFILLANSINFAFTDFKTKQKFSTEYNGNEWRGAFGMHACLKKALEGDFPFLLKGEYLASISEQDFREIFKGNFEIPLLKERLDIFHEVGRVLDNKYEGYFHNLVEESNHMLFNNGRGLVDRLIKDFPSFDDSVVYNGKKAKFYKRAQLAPGVLYGRFRNQGAFQVKDIDELTVFADYVLPKGLRDLGVLVYEKELAEKVDSQEIIPRHSREELEIRASTVHASDMLINKINELKGKESVSDGVVVSDGGVNALHLDYKLWSESRKQPGYHHLTPTIDY